jgi:hypothetical protein
MKSDIMYVHKIKLYNVVDLSLEDLESCQKILDEYACDPWILLEFHFLFLIIQL